jgi:hypothetical protein
MKKLKDYIGKTFKGFKFEDKEHSDLSYNYNMNKFIGKDLKIINYYEFKNCFDTDSKYHYPADLVIAQLENETFKPKRGDRVLVWDDEEENAIECIFLTEIEGALYPYTSVANEYEEDFINGDIFHTNTWKNIKPIQIAKDTLVWVKNCENNVWQQRFYSNFENGRHYCFLHQRKSNETKETAVWVIVTDKNPFE